MSELWFACPYCNKGISVEIEGQKADEDIYEICNKCNKKFKYYFTYSIDVFADKLNEGENK